MKLAKFLENTGVSPYEFAQSCGLAPTVIYKVIKEEKDIFLSVAVRISRSTNWVVRPEELISEKSINKKIKRPANSLKEKKKRLVKAKTKDGT